MKTEAKEKKYDFGNSGRGGGFHPGVFSDGFGDFSTMKKKSDNELKTETKRSSEDENPAIFVLTNESGFRGLWDKMFDSGYPKFSFKL